MQTLQRSAAVSLDAARLKWLALASMTLDHIGAVLLEPLMRGGFLSAAQWAVPDLMLRIVGRLAFPIYTFQLAEGFRRTGNRRAYGLRLALFALLSEPFYDFARTGQWADPREQNVFFTLFLGFLALECLGRFRNRPLPRTACAAGLCVLSQCIGADYGFQGVLLIAAFACWRGVTPETLQRRMLVLMAGGFFVFDALALRGETQLAPAALAQTLASNAFLHSLAFFAVPLVLCYNGEKGAFVREIFFLRLLPGSSFSSGACAGRAGPLCAGLTAHRPPFLRLHTAAPASCGSAAGRGGCFVSAQVSLPKPDAPASNRGEFF